MGSYTFSQMPAGDYSLNVTATGLALATPQAVTVTSGKTTVQNLALSIAVDQQQITVTEQGAGLDTSPDNNAGAIVIKGEGSRRTFRRSRSIVGRAECARRTGSRP